MPIGLIPARGDWEYRFFETASAATFPKGSLVQLDNAYRLKEYASTDSSVLGIAMSHSTASQTLRGLKVVLVAVPSPGCTAEADIQAGVNNSDISTGKKVAAEKVGNYMSYCSTVIGHASRFSAVFTVVGPIQTSPLSRVEVAFNMENVGLYSASSTTYAS